MKIRIKGGKELVGKIIARTAHTFVFKEAETNYHYLVNTETIEDEDSSIQRIPSEPNTDSSGAGTNQE